MAENWIDFTDGDVLEPTSKERQSIAAVKGRDDLADICAEVIDQVRQAYAFGNRDLGPDGQIPQGLKSRAIAIAIWRFVSEGVPKNESIQTKQRESAFDEATKYLERIGEVSIGKTSEPSVSTTTPKFDQASQDGI